MKKSSRSQSPLSPGLLCSLALLAAAGPLGTDMYLPTFVTISRDLSTSASSVQLTLSAFMVGIALGQLFLGPISDSLGRKKPLIAESILFLLASIGCAIVPSIGIFIALRFIQGFAGGATAVVARSVVPDLARGRDAASAFSTLMSIQGLAPAIAPLLGGFLSPIVGWRGVFWIIALFNLGMLAVAVVVVPESRDESERSTGALKSLFPNIVRCLKRPAFAGYLLAYAIGFGVLFSYISASPFVLQKVLGLPTHIYSLTFALNSLAIAAMSALNGRLIRRFETRKVLIAGLCTLMVTSLMLVIVGLCGPWLWPTLILLFITAAAVGLLLGNATALGVDVVRDIGAGAGTGAMGAGQFLTAGAVAPLVGLGSAPEISMALCMTGCAAIALSAGVFLTRGSSAIESD